MPTTLTASLEVLAGRFRLGEQASAGGMGRVYRGVDLQRNAPVAIKLMHEELSALDVARFIRESEVLAQLDHPGIVAYIAHGRTADGAPFLVMEWLDGEDLAHRLARAPLSAAESLQLARRVAAALAEAHGNGVVHRDLKPANLFLRHGAVDRVTLVDFGIARQSGVMPSLTRAGGLIGTPGYLAPEQARGLKSIGAPADIFALGCVLFECLTGHSPFAASHLTEALARLLFEPAPSLAQVRPDLPPQLDALLDAMLAKDPAQRIQSARELVTQLDALPPVTDGPMPAVADVRQGLGALEQRLVNVLIASPLVPLVDQETVELDGVDAARPSLAEALMSQGARVEIMGNGALVATLALDDASAVDQAVHAVGLARMIRERWPDTVVALATGRGVFDGRHPLGEALTRAGDLLPQAVTLRAQFPTACILLEDVTAGLVESRLRTVRLASGVSTVHDAEVTADDSRLLLGKPTPCLGREPEIGTLEMALRATLEEGSAHAVLVTGPPGIGKYRLRHEFLRRVPKQPEPVLQLAGRAEAGQTAAPYAVLGSALRGLFATATAHSAALRRARLRARVAHNVAPQLVDRVAEFLGELCDVPFADDASLKLRSARQDPRILRDQIAAAWLDFLRAECAVQPVLLLLEDLHWGDRASADLVELALRELQDAPLLVVGFARPEVAEHLPGLWKGRAQELPLRPLGRRACEQLVRQVLGAGVAAELVARIVEQAAGNALFLEELIRAAAAGKADRLPATVLAMLQARISRLDTELRRALRAASVFGEAFVAGGMHALLGPPTTPEDVAVWLRELQRHEIVELPRDVAADDGAPLRFRHALMREAAYSLLTDDDRTLGHRLAAEFLAARQDEPAVIGGHWLRANRPAEAVPWFRLAAERAYDRDDHTSAGQLAMQALAGEPQGEELGVLLALDADARVWRWEWAAAMTQFDAALALLPPGGVWWSRAVQGRCTLLAYRGTVDSGLLALCEQFLATEPLPGATLAYANCAAYIASGCTQVGLTALGATLLARIDAVLGPDDGHYPALGAWRRLVNCTYLRHTHDDLAAQVVAATAAVQLYRDVGASAMMLGIAHDVLGEILCRVGDFTQGLQMLRDAVATAQRGDVAYLVTHGRQCLANSLILAGAPDEAAATAQALLATPGISPGFQAMARHVQAQASLAQGDLVTAEAEARAAIALSPHTPIRRLQMQATLVRTLTAAGQLAESQAVAATALAEMAGYDGGGYAELAVLMAASASAEAAGAPAEAAALRRRARAKLNADAALFADPAARHRFLTAVHLHVEIAGAVPENTAI